MLIKYPSLMHDFKRPDEQSPCKQCSMKDLVKSYLDSHKVVLHFFAVSFHSADELPKWKMQN